jgi:hypothetical protein
MLCIVPGALLTGGRRTRTLSHGECGLLHVALLDLSRFNLKLYIIIA